MSKILDEAGKFVIGVWLTKVYLPRTARDEPKYFVRLMKQVGATPTQATIMVRRYIERRPFKTIPGEGVNLDIRSVFREHKRVIDKLIAY